MLAEDKAGLFLKRMNDQHLNILISGAGLGLNQYFLDTATTTTSPPQRGDLQLVQTHSHGLG